MKDSLIDRDCFVEYRKQYYSQNGRSELAAELGWLPQTDCKRRVTAHPKLSVELRYNKRPLPGDNIPFFYFCVCLLEKNNQPTIKFMLEPRAFFSLIVLVNRASQNSETAIAARSLAYQDKDCWDLFTQRGSDFHAVRHPGMSTIEHYRAKVPSMTTPITVFREPIHIHFSGKDGKYHHECYWMRIYYTPRQTASEQKNLPWQIQIENLVQKTRYAFSQRDYRRGCEDKVSLSTEDFYDAVMRMWVHYVRWWNRVSKNAESNPSQDNALANK